MKKSLGIFFTFSLLLFIAITLQAADNNAGSILSEQRQLKKTSPASVHAPIETTIDKEQSSLSGPPVEVRSFRFTGYQGFIALDELERLSVPYLNKTMLFEQLQQLVLNITDYLQQKKGYLLARAYLPQQDITNGIVTIAVTVAGLDGAVETVVHGPSRIYPARVKKIAQNALDGRGAVLRRDVERAVLLIDDLPGISARAYLDKGMAPGTTHLSIHTDEGRLLFGTAMLDNFGNRYTGILRRVLTAGAADFFGQGDFFQMSYINADNLNQGSINSSFPLGSDGLMADFAYTGLRYELGDKLKSLSAQGFAHTINAGVRYPVLRSRDASLWLCPGFEYYILKDRAAAMTASSRDISALRFELSGNFYDAFYRGGISSLSAAINVGNDAIDDGKSDDALGARNDGDFIKFSYALARLQKMTERISLFVSLRGQVSDSNLDSSQKFILGGPAGVRAYPVGEACGDEGNIVTIEKRYDLPYHPAGLNIQIVEFIDAGHIFLHKRTWANSVTNISGRNHYWLAGFGPGINLEKSDWLKVQFSYAHKIGKNIGRNTHDRNADNRKDSGRFWLQSSLYF